MLKKKDARNREHLKKARERQDLEDYRVKKMHEKWESAAEKKKVLDREHNGKL